ncbi:ATP-binding protein, partial [Streptomyces sp. B1866]|uniref:sensor histidine kinase n=1 Tax=Streptomyces sp. B1866 TaxID=3075431 RepID=UPI00288FF8DA
MRQAVLPAATVLALSAGSTAALLATDDAGPEAVGATLAAEAVAGLAVLGVAGRRARAAAEALRQDSVADDDVLRHGVGHLRSVIAEGQGDILRLMARIRRGERPEAPERAALVPGGAGRLAELELALGDLVHAAQTSVVEASARQQVAVFVNIARRLQTLVTRSLTQLDALEREVEDPELLEGLFLVDHLVTRVRRQVESLAVLGGAVPRRISKPVSVYTMLRQAVAEIEHYARVKVHQPIEGVLHGHAAADVVHLVAELVENAASFSPPDTVVQVRGGRVPAGLAIEIDDRGLVMSADLRDRMNDLLASPDSFDIGEQLKDGRIGLFVVAQLSKRHGITVKLQSNVYGGNQAVIVLPQVLLADQAPQAAGSQQGAAKPLERNRQPQAPAREPMPALASGGARRHAAAPAPVAAASAILSAAT